MCSFKHLSGRNEARQQEGDNRSKIRSKGMGLHYKLSSINQRLCSFVVEPTTQPVNETAVLSTSPIRFDESEDEGDGDGAVPNYGGGEIPGGLEDTGTTSKRVKFKLRSPSKLEQRIMEAARQRQRDGITKTQVVLGREYKGSGFAASPSTIDFTDFDVGVPMTLRFILTNVSLTFNSFKSKRVWYDSGD